jgi:hypothetical protein
VNTSAPTKIELKEVAMACCSNDYITFVNKSGRVFVMGNPSVRGINNTQAKSKMDIVELPIEHITKVSSGVNFTMALDD